VLPAKARASQRARIAKIVARLPEAEVREQQHVACSVRGKKFAYHLVDHHGDDRVSFQCKAEKGVNRSLVESDPDRFFMPPYMAQHGWIGMWLDDGPVDWDEIEAYLVDAYRLTAPKSLTRDL
jgi:predicted DNA-binding protein (MmcQ/YjbR family)